MTLDDKNIEALAVIAVSQSVLDTDTLFPYIDKNDKTPLWDGDIKLYSNKNKTNSNFVGRVPVQVRGKVSKKRSLSQVSYSVEILALKSYRKDGGVLFFVVYIDSANNNQTKIYYNALTPVMISSCLKDLKEKQKSKSIVFKEFPLSKSKKLAIFHSFLENSKKQKSFNPGMYIPIDEIYKNQLEFQFNLQAYADTNEINESPRFLDSEIYIYVNASIGETKALIPVDTIVESIDMIDVVKQDVTIEDKLFYTEYKRIYSLTNRNSIQIGTCLTFEVDFDLKKVQATISTSDFLRERTTAYRFLIALIKSKGFYIGGKKIELPIDEEGLKEINIERLEEQLVYYHKVLKLLDILNVSEDLNISKLTEEQKKGINVLIKALASNKEVGGVRIASGNDYALVNYHVANLTFKLFISKNKKTGKYRIEDFFNSKLIKSYVYRNDEKIATPPYYALEVEDYIKVSNIDYAAILPSYKSLEKKQNSYVFEQATNNMLNMLAAYDINKKAALFEAVKEISDWIYENESYSEINLLNKLQVIKRERELLKSEKKKLIELIDNENQTHDIKVAAYLLLDNQELAEFYFDKMNVKEQDLFKKYPIYTFW